MVMGAPDALAASRVTSHFKTDFSFYTIAEGLKCEEYVQL